MAKQAPTPAKSSSALPKTAVKNVTAQGKLGKKK